VERNIRYTKKCRIVGPVEVSVLMAKENYMGYKEFYGEKSTATKLIFVLIVLYTLCSIVVLLLALGFVFPKVPSFYHNPRVLIVFSVISFVVTVVISVHHLSTLIKRRKRKTDI
jgi:hypothetical protein